MSLICTKNYQIYYELKVVDKNLPLVIFIHGYNTTLASLRSLAVSQNAKFNSLLFDLPGFGDSKIDKVITFDDFKAAIELLFEYVDISIFSQIYVVGHSLGGAIATWMTSTYEFIKAALLATPLTHFYDYDEEFANKLRKLISPSTIEEGKTTMRAMLYPPLEKNWEEVISKAAVLLVRDYFAWKNQVKELIDTMILNKNFLQRSLQRHYKKAADKLTILAAEVDEFTPPEFLEKVAKQLNICFAKVPNSGHAIFFGRVELFVNLINLFVSGSACQNLQEFIQNYK